MPHCDRCVTTGYHGMLKNAAKHLNTSKRSYLANPGSDVGWVIGVEGQGVAACYFLRFGCGGQGGLCNQMPGVKFDVSVPSLAAGLLTPF